MKTYPIIKMPFHLTKEYIRAQKKEKRILGKRQKMKKKCDCVVGYSYQSCGCDVVLTGLRKSGESFKKTINYADRSFWTNFCPECGRKLRPK